MKDHKSHLLKFFGYIAKHKVRVLIVFFSAVMVSLSMMFFGKQIKLLVDQSISSGNLSALNSRILMVLLSIFLFAASSFVRSYFAVTLADLIVVDMKFDIYQLLLKLNVTYFVLRPQSEVNQIFTSKIAASKQIILAVFSFLIRTTLVFTFCLVAICQISMQLSLAIVAGICLIVVPLSFASSKVKNLTKQNVEMSSKVDDHIFETTSSIKNIYAFNRQQDSLNKLRTVIDKYLNNNIKVSVIRSCFFSFAILSVCSLIILVIWLAARDIMIGRITSGELVSFIFYAIMMVFSMSGILQTFDNLQNNIALVSKALDVIDESQQYLIEDYINDTNVPLCDNSKSQNIIELGDQNPKTCSLDFQKYLDRVESIDMHFVSFAYPSNCGLKILDNFSCNFIKGLNVIYGKSGIGKTTIFELLLKFYKCQNGDIKINDINIQDIDTKLLRSLIGYVPQSPFMFSGTLRENILFGAAPKSEEFLKHILQITYITNFLDQLPNGLDTFVGTNGQMLSGGQCQRIGIARALLRNPQILILDESTNALDSETESNVINNIRMLMNDKFILAIAHRTSIINMADQKIEISKR